MIQLCISDNNKHLVCANDGKPNFYSSPWVQESKKCSRILEEVKTDTLSLLDQWPDFPTLKDVSVDRVDFMLRIELNFFVSFRLLS
jgi:hypothetical protein